MAARRPLMSRIWPVLAVEPSLASWRAALTVYTIRVVLLGAAVTLAIVALSFWPDPPAFTVKLVAACYIAAVLLMAALRRSARARAAVLLSTVLVISPVILIANGPGAAGFLCLLAACVLAAVLIGPRAAAVFMAVSVAIILMSAQVHLSGWGAASPHPAETLRQESNAWFRVGWLWFAVTGWVVYVTSWLIARIGNAMRQTSAARATAQDEGVRRQASEQQRLATEAALIEAQKHEAMGRIAGGVSHDFNNALFVILGWNDLLSRGGVSESQRQQGHAAIASAGRSAAELAQRLVNMSRQRAGQPQVMLLRPWIEECVRNLSRLLPDDIRVSAELADVPAVSVDAHQLEQVLLNLSLNARDAMPDGGRLTFTLRLTRETGVHEGSATGEWVEIGVRDTGHGMDEPTRRRLFEPRFTTKQHTGGAGLGLATSHTIVQRAGGRVEVESERGRGSCFRVLLPVAAPAAGGLGPPPQGVPGRRARLLVVEDDEAVRELIAVALRSHGHRVDEAADGDQAMQRLDASAEPYDLLCVDGLLPGAPATAVIERFRVGCPGCPVLVCSGAASTPQLQALVDQEKLTFLLKPFTPDELAAQVDALLAWRSPSGTHG